MIDQFLLSLGLDPDLTLNAIGLIFIGLITKPVLCILWKIVSSIWETTVIHPIDCMFYNLLRTYKVTIAKEPGNWKTGSINELATTVLDRLNALEKAIAPPVVEQGKKKK